MQALRTLITASLLAFASGLAALAAPAPVAPAPRSLAPAQRPPAATGLPTGRVSPQAPKPTLPDTTLVRVSFTRGHADVTLSQMRIAAYRLGAWPDSLTPDGTRQVLGLLVQQTILTHWVREAGRHWTAADSAQFALTADRLTLGAALDSALSDLAYRLAARGDSVPDRDGLGIMLRDSAFAALHPVYDEDMLRRLAAAFAARPKSSFDLPILQRVELDAAMPAVSREDSARTLVATDAGSCTVSQLLSDLARVSATRRPQVHGAEDLRDLCKGKVYENLLRRAAAGQALALRPAIARQLREVAEYLDVQRFLTRQIYEKIAIDSTTLRRHFQSAPERFLAPAQAVVVRTELGKLDDADTLAHRLTLPGFAESLVVQSTRAGIPYRAIVDEHSDSVLFARARRAGVGAVIGPDPVQDGWRVLKVMELSPRRARPFAEAFDDVRSDWGNRETERRMRELMTQLSAASIVNVNQASPYLTGRRRIPR